MIFQKSENDVKNMGFQSNSQMSVQVADLSKIFKILSTSTYKDPYGSIIRELCCNAVDANVAAGKAEHPIYLTYDRSENTISIKDDGIGMSDEFVNTKYMSLGFSTKDEDEEQIGGFGIGRASIFSYTTYYTLISRYDGMKRIYLISENENGLPDVLPIGEEETEECNGVEVKFELKSNDMWQFINAAKNQLKYFRYIIITGFDGITNDYQIFQGDHFVFRSDRSNVTGNLEIVWHNVCYPIDFVSLGMQPIKSNCSLYFPQNTPFMPEAARENLRNIEVNRTLVKEKIQLFIEEITRRWKDQQVVESFFEWRRKNNKSIDVEGYNIDVSNLVKEEYIWKPLLDTNMDVKSVKSYSHSIFEKCFSYRKNSKNWSNSWEQITQNKHIYYANKEVSNYRLSSIGWAGLVLKRENVYIGGVRDLQYFYGNKIDYDKTTGKLIEPEFDYNSEISYIQDCIWNEITSSNKDAHSIELAKKTINRKKISHEEVRGKFNDSWSTQNQWGIRTTKYLNKFIHVVYTTDIDEYKKWQEYRPKVFRKGKEVENFFILCFTNEKHAPKLSGYMTIKEFMDSDYLKRVYYKNYTQENIPNANALGVYRNMHNMYRVKFRHLVHKENSSTPDIPYRIKEYLKEKYSTEHIDRMYSRQRQYIDKYRTDLNANVLKYKMLYEFKSKQLNKFKENCNEIKAVRS